MKFHDAANLFPMDEESLGELMEDIRKHGQRVPVELLDGEIIDGRRRATACNRLGIKPKTVDVQVDDPVAYVCSLNLHRRHLTPSQRAMIAKRADELIAKLKEQAKERQKRKPAGSVVATVPPQNGAGKTRDQLGKMFDVGGRLIDYAGMVVEKGVPELAKAVEEGRMSVTSAAKATELDEELQRQAAQEADFSGGRYRRKPINNEPDAVLQNGKATKPGVGVRLGHEAVNCLIRIPKDDPLRKRGFQIVTDWIKANS
jgi:ParB-like chromosome segregation protein Spo0J